MEEGWKQKKVEHEESTKVQWGVEGMEKRCNLVLKIKKHGQIGRNRKGKTKSRKTGRRDE